MGVDFSTNLPKMLFLEGSRTLLTSFLIFLIAIDQSVTVKRLFAIFLCNVMFVGIESTRVSSADDHWGVSGTQHPAGLALKIMKTIKMNHYQKFKCNTSLCHNHLKAQVLRRSGHDHKIW